MTDFFLVLLNIVFLSQTFKYIYMVIVYLTFSMGVLMPARMMRESLGVI